jgi:hypothetical protein
MTKEQFAAMLNNRQYGDEITKEECQLAKDCDLLVAFGYSDDGLELRGLIEDELGAWEGLTLHIFLNANNGKTIYHKAGQETSPIASFLQLKPLIIEAIWCPDKLATCPDNLDTSWLIKANVPHATFDIFDDEDLFCRGIVLDKKDIVKALQ